MQVGTEMFQLALFWFRLPSISCCFEGKVAKTDGVHERRRHTKGARQTQAVSSTDRQTHTHTMKERNDS